jgi:WD40 repeat protein
MNFIIRLISFMFIIVTFGIMHASDALTKPDDTNDDDRPVHIHLPPKDYKKHAGGILAKKAMQQPKNDHQSAKSQESLSLTQQIKSALPSMPSLHLTTRYVGLRASIDRILSINQSERFLVGDPSDKLLPTDLWAIVSAYAQLWTEIGQLKDPYRANKSAEFSLDGTRIVTVSDDGYRLWDSETKKSISSLSTSHGNISKPIFSSNSNYITAGCTNYCCKFLWDIKTGKCEVFGYTSLLKVSPKATCIVTLSDYASEASLLNFKDRKQIASFIGHSSLINSAQFSPDSYRIVTTANRNNVAILWSAYGAFALIAPMPGHRDSILSADFSPDSKHIITTSSDCTARLWNAITGKSIATLSGHTEAVHSAQFSPDNTRILTTSSDKTGRLWNANTKAFIATLNGHSGDIKAHFNSNSTRILTQSKGEDFVKLWDAKEGSLVGILAHPGTAVISAYFSPDGTQIIIASDIVSLRNASDGSEFMTIGQPCEHFSSARFNHDGAQIITTDGTTNAQIWKKVQL